jgi:hypothetical protein
MARTHALQLSLELSVTQVALWGLFEALVNKKAANKTSNNGRLNGLGGPHNQQGRLTP